VDLDDAWALLSRASQDCNIEVTELAEWLSVKAS
jgi:hypothetical protein